mgnify:CR=1 FL=1
MDHVEWDGLTHHDTIFPLFLFIAGISFPFSLEKQREQGKSESDIYKRIVRRRNYAGVGWDVSITDCYSLTLRTFVASSVLARIGLGWMFAALLFVHFRTSVRAWIAGTILVGYWVWIAFILCRVRRPDLHAGATGRLCGSFVVAGAFASRIF